MTFLLNMLLAPLNHILRSQPWVQERLKRLQGKVITLFVTPMKITLEITEKGEFQAIDEPQKVDAELTISPALLPRLWLGDQDALRQIQINGEMQISFELGYIYRHLRWDATADLSQIFGSVLAVRIVETAKKLAKIQELSVRHLLKTTTYSPTFQEFIIAPSETMNQWLHQVDYLRDDVERLDKRLFYIERRLKQIKQKRNKENK